MNAGRLITFEGLDGSGKSTQVVALAGTCRAAGADVLVTREPTRGPVGRRIRAMARSGKRIAPQEELQWFMEDRRAHVEEVIRPALEAGRLVLTDRYFLSTVAYQGARGLDPQQLLAQNEAEFPLPDLALVLEIDVKVALARVAARRLGSEPVFEEHPFLERVAAIFAEIECPYLVRIDGRPAPEAVARAVLEAVRQRLSLP